MKQNSTLFVGGLSFNITESHLFDYFNSFGEVRKVNLLKKPSTGLSKGYAFVFFAQLEDMYRVLSQEDHFIQGRKVDCQRAMERPQKEAHHEFQCRKRIFVGKLDYGTKDTELTEHFSKFGKVKSAYIITDNHTQKSLCFGYVVFKEGKSAKKALQERNHLLKGRRILVRPYKSKKDFHNNARENSQNFGSERISIPYHKAPASSGSAQSRPQTKRESLPSNTSTSHKRSITFKRSRLSKLSKMTSNANKAKNKANLLLMPSIPCQAFELPFFKIDENSQLGFKVEMCPFVQCKQTGRNFGYSFAYPIGSNTDVQFMTRVPNFDKKLLEFSEFSE